MELKPGSGSTLLKIVCSPVRTEVAPPRLFTSHRVWAGRCPPDLVSLGMLGVYIWKGTCDARMTRQPVDLLVAGIRICQPTQSHKASTDQNPKLMIDLKLSTDVYDLRDAIYAILKSLKLTANTWAYLALGSLLLFGGSLVYSWLKDKRIDRLEGKAKAQETRAEMWTQNARTKEELTPMHQLQNQALALQVASLKEQLKPIPPKPGPVPVDGELVANLKMFGLKKEVKLFNADEYNQLHFGDAQLIWTWASEAQRVPSLEDGIVRGSR